jgi:hypothetical protein
MPDFNSNFQHVMYGKTNLLLTMPGGQPQGQPVLKLRWAKADAKGLELSVWFPTYTVFTRKTGSTIVVTSNGQLSTSSSDRPRIPGFRKNVSFIRISSLLY